MRLALRCYLNNSMLPATLGLADDWQPTGFSIDRMRHGYAVGDSLWRSEHELNITYDPLPVGITEEQWQKAMCDRLFRYLNDDERPNGKTERSMSVGDVCQVSAPLGSWWYACESEGWRKIDPPGRAVILNA